ncbi:hypothetical protein LTR84_006097 [Exophiala bonariae]|uniref:Uncharacterized protein n=1 Tax=Exophiala bonariae TaxID=1690606 RepID=A0AAV9N1M2_9EURO|nr:hypothetical protein LTR84_006097 [Exophiala bonariae]
MSTRGEDRSYKVVYASRNRGSDRVEDEPPPRRSRRDYDYDYGYDHDKSYSRDYQDERILIDRSGRSDDPRGYHQQSTTVANRTKTTYEVGRDRNSEAYVKRSNALVLAPANPRSEFEVLRPQRRDDGTYVVDLSNPRGYDERDYGYQPRTKYYDAPPPSRTRRDDDVIIYDSSRTGGRDRTISHASYHKDVQVMEDIDDDPRDRRRGRVPEIVPEETVAPPARLRSSMRGRNDSPPEDWKVRRSHSVGFFKDQISRHDASESRHERPGAEAHLAGRYLHHHDDYDDDERRSDYEERARVTQRARSRSRSRGGHGHGPRHSDPRLRDYDHEDERRSYTEETMRDYEYEDRRDPYPPQRESRRHRHHHHHDDDRSAHSEYETVTRTKKEYYR